MPGTQYFCWPWRAWRSVQQVFLLKCWKRKEVVKTSLKQCRPRYYTFGRLHALQRRDRHTWDTSNHPGAFGDHWVLQLAQPQARHRWVFLPRSGGTLEPLKHVTSNKEERHKKEKHLWLFVNSLLRWGVGRVGPKQVAICKDKKNPVFSRKLPCPRGLEELLAWLIWSIDVWGKLQ